jgi:hypothetical protein
MTGPYGTSPSDNSDYLWVQANPSLNRDDVLQYFVNIQTGQRVWGRTSGSFSDHIHLYSLAGADSHYNMDPVSGEISKDGNFFGLFISIGEVIASFVFPPAGVGISVAHGVGAGAQAVVSQSANQQGSAWYQDAGAPAPTNTPGPGSILGLSIDGSSVALIVAIIVVAFVVLE